MKHLKLGTYSFVIDADKLGLVSGTAFNFTREQLPDELKPLFDVLKVGKINEKSIFVNVKSNNLTEYGGYLIQYSATGYSLPSVDGDFIVIEFSPNNKLIITYKQY